MSTDEKKFQVKSIFQDFTWRNAGHLAFLGVAFSLFLFAIRWCFMEEHVFSGVITWTLGICVVFRWIAYYAIPKIEKRAVRKDRVKDTRLASRHDSWEHLDSLIEDALKAGMERRKPTMQLLGACDRIRDLVVSGMTWTQAIHEANSRASVHKSLLKDTTPGDLKFVANEVDPPTEIVVEYYWFDQTGGSKYETLEYSIREGSERWHENEEMTK